jgi:hypothetical protein
LLSGEIFSVLANESLYRETIQKLETDLSVYKRAYNEVEAERRQLENLKQEAEKQKEHLENQLQVRSHSYVDRIIAESATPQGHRIVTLLDGDGAIFSNDLIAQGQAGGHTAAQKLSDSIVQHLSTNYGSNQYQLWVYVFFNKRGLMDTFGRVGLASLKQKFEDFVMGFNQAAERFLMVDVGTAKEAADAKIKGSYPFHALYLKYSAEQKNAQRTWKMIFVFRKPTKSSSEVSPIFATTRYLK